MISIKYQTLTETQENNALGVTLSFAVVDDTFNYVQATVYWGDGTVWSSGRAANPLNVSIAHGYGPGDFVVRVVAANFRLPRADTAEWSQDVSYYQTPSGNAPQTPAEAGYSYIGPQLPTGRNWDWDTVTDNTLLSGSLELLIRTNTGEYLMDSNYGANLRPLVFSPNDGVLVDIARGDISQKAATYEPRAQLQQMTSSQTGNTLTVNPIFASLISPGQIPLSVVVPG